VVTWRKWSYKKHSLYQDSPYKQYLKLNECRIWFEPEENDVDSIFWIECEGFGNGFMIHVNIDKDDTSKIENFVCCD